MQKGTRRRKQSRSEVSKAVGFAILPSELERLDALRDKLTSQGEGKRPSRSMLLVALIRSADLTTLKWNLAKL